MTKDTEIWRTVEGFEGYYEVSNLGRVRSVDRVDNMGHFQKGKLLVGGIDSYGYKKVGLCKNGKVKTITVHRLVAETFIPNPDNLPCINHKDEDKNNNTVWNLEWCTVEYNDNYGTRNEKIAKTKSIPVLQIKNGIVVKEWESAKEAGKVIGVFEQNIAKCLKGKKNTAYGYEWRYA